MKRNAFIYVQVLDSENPYMVGNVKRSEFLNYILPY
jgi:hypothetical protein